MGIIQRQSIKNSIVNYLGVAVGALSTLFIYPHDLGLYGSVQIWIACAALLIPMLTLGSHSLVQKYYPYFKINGYKGFLKMIFLLTSGIVVAMSLLLYLSKGYILNLSFVSEGKKAAFNSALGVIYPLSILLIFIAILRAQAANLKRIVVPDLIQKLGFKLFLPCVFIAVIWQYISKEELKIGIILFYFFVLVFFAFYLKKIKGLDINGNDAIINSKPQRKEMRSYMGFNVLNQIGHVLAYQIDKIMLGVLMTSAAAGTYAIFLFLSTIIDIPTKAIYQISGPIVAQSFEKNDLGKIESLYKKSSINLLIIGVFLFSLIWLNIENVFDIMSNGSDLRPYKMLFLFLGMAKLLDMLTSINGFIIIYSKYYKYNLIFIGVMAVSNVITNIFFIRAYGIIGVGIATAISIMVYNLIRSGFIWFKLGMHPFAKKMLILLGILAMTFVTAPFVGLDFHPLINTIIVSFIFVLLFVPIVYYSNISEDVNGLIKKGLKLLNFK